jgi:hypothetical protein
MSKLDRRYLGSIGERKGYKPNTVQILPGFFIGKFYRIRELIIASGNNNYGSFDQFRGNITIISKNRNVGETSIFPN